ncbi:hypothetical protein BKA61DRAFT_716562 [Leptodontidium sp. MPI-SDFR-AT-0119]|nr:hypothetical protein BKA61DRAFT_716562 [Leptodontidium sp. MPI-SDFR-AT-0119]
MKIASACLQCRKGKRKCNTSTAGSACPQCSKRGLRCSSLRVISTPNSTTTLQPTPVREPQTLHSDQLPSKEITEHLVDLYISYLHDKPHTMFHEPSLRRSAQDGTLSQAVLFAIFGLSARFSKNQDIRGQGHVWSATARKLVRDDLEHACVENIQACILVGTICLADSRPDSESIFFALANRMAELLKLPITNTANDVITSEINRRVWWSLYMIDRWASAGLGLARQIHLGDGAPQLPMDEVQFRKLNPTNTTEILENWKPGIWSHMITLAKIFGDIQDLNRMLVEDEAWEEDQIESRVLGLAEELTSFERDLPPKMSFSSENLNFQQKQGVGRAFVALHLGYHHYATLLYYQYLDQRRPPTPTKRIFTERCKYHAIAFCELISTSAKQGDSEALHNVVGHMTVVSSSVLLHTLLLGDDEELPMARQRLESNFEFLVRLRDIWPSVNLMMKRLITFQNECLRTSQQGTHRFDKWMLKFLLQHSLNLDEKDTSRSNEAPLRQIYVEDERLLQRSRITESIIFG